MPTTSFTTSFTTSLTTSLTYDPETWVRAVTWAHRIPSASWANSTTEGTAS